MENTVFVDVPVVDQWHIPDDLWDIIACCSQNIRTPIVSAVGDHARPTVYVWRLSSSFPPWAVNGRP